MAHRDQVLKSATVLSSKYLYIMALTPMDQTVFCDVSSNFKLTVEDLNG